jgi:hypothetical protein
MMAETDEDPSELHVAATAQVEANALVSGLFGGETQIGMHIYDPNQARRDELERARQLVYEACQICQQVLAEI